MVSALLLWQKATVILGGGDGDGGRPTQVRNLEPTYQKDQTLIEPTWNFLGIKSHMSFLGLEKWE